MPLFYGWDKLMHWLHSLDQIVFTVGGACHTSEEYLRVLHELREDRQFAIASAFAESKRGQSKQALSELVISDRRETPVNKYKAEATVLENKSRRIIAQPALDAARVELFLINTLLERVSVHVDTSKIPLVFHTIQKTENHVACLWRAFVELITYGSVSLETNAQLLSRSLPIELGSVFGETNTREAFYETIRPLVDYQGVYITATIMQQLYTESVKVLSTSEHIEVYKQHFLESQGITDDLPRLLHASERPTEKTVSVER